MRPPDEPVLPDPSRAEAKEIQVREMFSRIAPTYDLLNRLLSCGIDRRWRAAAVRKLSLPSPARVLDLCGGTGDFGLGLLRVRPSDTVVLADFAIPMLERAAPRLSRFGTRHSVLCGDALRLPFGDGSFDGCLCAFGVRNWVDPGAGFDEVLRVLRPGGEFAILEFLQAEGGWTEAIGRLYTTHVLPRVGGWVSGDRNAYRYLARSMDRFLAPEEFEALLVARGFRSIARKRFFLGLCRFYLARKE